MSESRKINGDTDDLTIIDSFMMKFSKLFTNNSTNNNNKNNNSNNHNDTTSFFDEIFNLNPLASRLITSYQKKICNYDKQQCDRSSIAILSSINSAIDDQIIRNDNSYNVNNSSTTTKSTPPRSSNANQITNNLINADLIDLDLISGSAYTIKSKSQQGWISMLFHAILRVIFFPLYLRWWSEQTNAFLVTILFILYIMQIVSIRIYYYNLNRNYNSNTNTNASSATSSTSFNSTLNQYSSANSSFNNRNEFADISATEILMPIAMMIVLGIIHTQIVGTKSFKSSSSSTSSSTTSNNAINNHNQSSKDISPISNNNRKINNTNNSTNHQHHHHHHSSTHNQTDCSSSSGNSSSSSSSSSSSPSVDSSPVSNVRQRLHNRAVRMEKYKNTNADDNEKCDHISTAATIDSKPPLPKINDINHDDFNDLPKIRFYSENRSFDRDDSIDTLMQNEFPLPMQRKRSDSLLKSWSKHNKKLRSKSNRLNVASQSLNWNYDDDHLNSSPLLLRSSLYGSSIDSEGTISPMTPTILQENEWPPAHSDASSEEEEDNDHDHGHINKDFLNHSCFNDNGSTKISRSSSKIDKKNDSKEHGSNHIDIYQNSQQQQPKASANITSGTTAAAAVSNELKVSCSLWQQPNICQKYDLNVVDIGSSIIRKVESVEHSNEYFYLGIMFSLTIAMLPTIYRLQYSTKDGPTIAQILNSSSLAAAVTQQPIVLTTDISYLSDLYGIWTYFLEEAFYFNRNSRIRFIIITAMIERFVLSLIFFFLLCVTERTFKQRFLYSKYFSHITRRDRAKRSQIPHFRLHKVRNLKVWLSVRSYLRRYGPHRTVDTICSTTFIISICLLTCISLQILKDSNESCTTRLICWEMIFWSLAMGIYIMRLMILGSRINQKYRSNLSVLITEQINLYLQLERKPHKKDALMLANQVLKLAVDLLKELESPYKISGFSANPYLYNITKVVVLSAFSAVLTEMLGFKLKLYKIKLIR